MRSFSTVYPQFWNGKTGKLLRKSGAEAQVVALYLITGPHSHMSGVYYLPKNTISYETGLTQKSVTRALKEIERLEFAYYDEESEHVWVKEMLAWQVKGMKPEDRRLAGVVKWFNGLPSLTFMAAVYLRYQEFLPGLVAPSKDLGSPFGGPTQQPLPRGSIPVSSPVPSQDSREGGPGEETADPKKKLKYGDFGNVLLTLGEHADLVTRFGEEGAANRIRDADLYFGSKGKASSYKSHHLTILNWDRKEQGSERKLSKSQQLSKQSTDAATRVISRHLDANAHGDLPDARRRSTH